MFYREISKILGLFLLGFATTLLIPFGLAAYYEFFADKYLHPQPHTTWAFLESFLITCGFGLLFYRLGQTATGNVYRKEGLIIVVAVWFILPAFSSLPFLLSQTLDHPLQAYFETSSGLTTTGSTVLVGKKYNPNTGQEEMLSKDVRGDIDVVYQFYGTVKPVRDPQTGQILYEGIEAIGKALLFWRSFLQFLGGGGIIVFFVAILPALGVGGKVLYQAEVPGPVKDSVVPRIKEGALQLWKIYIFLVIAEIFILMITNDQMPFFDALTISFATVSTGGFSIKNTSISYYQNAATDWVVMLFMFLGSVNFTLYFYILRGKIYRLFSAEFFLYLALTVIPSLFVAWYLIGLPRTPLVDPQAVGVYSFSEALRYGFFHVISAQTTTGFAIVDFDHWPYITQLTLLIVMYFGGMSGSTSGGIKTIRLYMLFRIAQNTVESLFRPSEVQRLQVADKEMDQKSSTLVLCFFLIVIFSATVGTFLLVMDSVDPETAMTIVSSSINNIGMAFRAAGPTESCAFLSNFGLAVCSFLMIFGRLEFFAVLAILVPAFWQKKT